MNDLMTLRDVMSYLGASYRTVRKMIERGDLTQVKWGDSPKYRRDEVEAIKRGVPADATQD